ncbi:MAG: glycosyltransferase family 2 protein [Candidatus Altiarchaeota archaeon]
MPRISVIIPAYNEEKYISRCLDSLLEQTYEDFEIIAIDDGSKDKTSEILKSYEKKYKKIKVLSQEHKGLEKPEILEQKKRLVRFSFLLMLIWSLIRIM